MALCSLTCVICVAQESSPPSLCSDWAQRSADWCCPEGEAGQVHSHPILPVHQWNTVTCWMCVYSHTCTRKDVTSVYLQRVWPQQSVGDKWARQAPGSHIFTELQTQKVPKRKKDRGMEVKRLFCAPLWTVNIDHDSNERISAETCRLLLEA